MDVEKPELLLVSEVQKRLRLSRNGVYDAINRGQIPSIRFGRRILVPRLEFEQLLHVAPTMQPDNGGGLEPTP